MTHEYLTLRCFYWAPRDPGWRRIDPPWILLNASPLPAPLDFADGVSILDEREAKE